MLPTIPNRQTSHVSGASEPSVYSQESWGDASDYDDHAFDDSDCAPPVTRDESDKVLSGAELLSEQENEIKRIVDLFEMSRINAAALLAHYHWNAEKLIDRYSEDADKVLEAAGLNLACAETVGGATCGVCFCDCAPHELSASPRCAHAFCNDCWAGYLVSQIGDGAASGIMCMAHKCRSPSASPPWPLLPYWFLL